MLMYIKAYLIPSEKRVTDEWIINLYLEDHTKIEAKIVKTYKACLKESKDWSIQLGGIPYEVGGIKYGNASE